jgi:SNARE protein
MCLIGLIFIAIVVLIILSALGLDGGKFNTPDVVKGSLQTSGSSSTNTTTTGSG